MSEPAGGEIQGGAPAIVEQVEAFIQRWLRFQDSLRSENRFFPDTTFIDELVEICSYRNRTVPGQTPVFRARINPPGRTAGVLPEPDVRAPPPDRATAGRVNPERLPCLYTAFDIDTAIAEVQPFLNASVTVAEGRTTSDLVVVDLSGIPVTSTQPELFAGTVLGSLFSRPVHRDDPLEYLATQFLAERLKRDGLHGLKYSSSLRTGGVNVAFFQPQAVVWDTATLYVVDSVEVRSTPAPNVLPRNYRLMRHLLSPTPPARDEKVVDRPARPSPTPTRCPTP